jgi:RimJ/RimL family protein N-acetyltransferase
MDDVPEVTRACRDQEISRWILSIPSPYEEHHARWWIAQHDAQWAEGTQATFAVCPVSNSGLLGSMALEEIDPDRHTAVVSYWAAPWARNRGHTTRALQLVCLWAFEALAIEIVTLTTLEGNRASERVAEKNGFHLVEHISGYKPVVARDPQASYEVKRWTREPQSGPTGTST